VEATLSGKIGAIGTERTIASGAYHQALKSIDAEVQVFAKETPLLVGLAEEGWFDGPVVEAALRQYLTPWLQGAAEEIDTLVLGCTHYPALKGAISQCVQALLGREITLIDSAEAIADDLAERLPIAQVTAHPPREIELLATDALERFERVGGLFFPTHTAQLRLVDL
ncbi:MAG TPA: glutamate racemase, partial [Myxococcales bacterium]|nr:glutamate racemase [Myxococcales bacterium]